MQTGMGVWRLVETTQPGGPTTEGLIGPGAASGLCSEWQLRGMGVSELGNDSTYAGGPMEDK